ncbi:TetR/AcrR family transcriptional regulator [Sorangium sp. So ce726]|uniref:TetR/AcrR family transcriptional regulator n=1 Tax=Sorangium sp. So ce726 TaxID=3133319 RepID=UPI003F603A40
MARPKSDDKRNAIVAAAIRVIVKQGLSAATATIAREAGVANGSLFTYFETKTELYNQLYLELKSEMASAALEGVPANAALRKQCSLSWSNWTRWAVRNPEKRRALALLGVADDITPATRAAGHKTMAGLAELTQRCRANGPMRDAPFELVIALMTAVAEATMDFMVNDPARADQHCEVGFNAAWRMLAG